MKGAYRAGAAVVLALASTAAAFSQPSKLKQRMASEEAMLAKDAEATNRACGSSLAVKFDWAGAKEEDLFKYSPSGYCDAALQGIRQVCGDPSGKEAVRKQIKAVICGFGASRQITLRSKTAYYKINFSSSNDSDYVYEALENAL